jgi:hypothetical protein
MATATTIRESSVSPAALECLDCFSRSVDQHGRCETCGSSALAPVATPEAIKQWHTVVSLELAIARAVLHEDRRGECVLRRILREETEGIWQSH